MLTLTKSDLRSFKNTLLPDSISNDIEIFFLGFNIFEYSKIAGLKNILNPIIQVRDAEIGRNLSYLCESNFTQSRIRKERTITHNLAQKMSLRCSLLLALNNFCERSNSPVHSFSPLLESETLIPLSGFNNCISSEQ